MGKILLLFLGNRGKGFKRNQAGKKKDNKLIQYCFRSQNFITDCKNPSPRYVCLKTEWKHYTRPEPNCESCPQIGNKIKTSFQKSKQARFFPSLNVHSKTTWPGDHTIQLNFFENSRQKKSWTFTIGFPGCVLEVLKFTKFTYMHALITKKMKPLPEEKKILPQPKKKLKMFRFLLTLVEKLKSREW